MIYFDNASTYHPKCSAIPGAISTYLEQIIASPGRGSYRNGAIASKLIEDTKKLLCEFFNGDSAEQFHFCPNATHGLNYIIQGLLEKGDHVVTTSLEHNSVLRPLKKLNVEKNIQTTIVSSSSEGIIAPLDVINSIQQDTKLVVLNHASNVVGTITDLKPILNFCKKNGIKTLIDASQTAGHINIDVKNLGMDYLVATGHKALRGPSGTGIVYTRNIEGISPILVGGTGGNSMSLFHPQNPTTLFEAGTPNYLGIAGLNAAIKELFVSPSKLKKELELTKFIAESFTALNGIKVYGPSTWNNRIPLLSFNFTNMTPQRALSILDDTYDIAMRAGLHCAPLAHHMLGTLPFGTIRLSLSHGNSIEEVFSLINAVKEITREHQVSKAL